MSYLNNTISVPKPITVTLKQVAAWDLEHLNAPCEIKAGVPALQRGLVWSPRQVEFLWDSILRGFPIGSLVVSKQMDSQKRRGDKSGITHHLLDGQQRANAITLGFHDPFARNDVKVRDNKSESILWLDLAPPTTSCPGSQFPPNSTREFLNSTREFLTRVTTLAHPWGYRADDNALPLSAADARAGIKSEYEGRASPLGKPSSLQLFPRWSNAPVPLSWLLVAIEDGKDENGQDQFREKQDFWGIVKGRLKQEAAERRWPKLALEVLQQLSDTSSLNQIYHGVLRAVQTPLVILEAPEELLATSRQEKSNNDENAENIASIEHLFNRLNRLGTPLDGEELAYSMIKANWPDVADVIDAVSTRRVPASHLVSLGVRASITDSRSGKLARGMTIPRLRAIAKAVPPNEGEVASSAFEHRRQIEEFIGKQDSSVGAVGKDRLARACGKVDKWLVFDRDNSPNGLPPVLLSSFARGSSDIYLFLLRIADQLGTRDPAQDSEWNSLLPGLATLIHWFTRDDKLTIADLLLASTAREISPQNVRDGITEAIEKDLIVMPRHPDELEKFIKFPDGKHLMDWEWWKSLIEAAPEEERAKLQNTWKPFLKRTAWGKELLLYGQRSYLDRQFNDYDPSRKDLWENHNRPWDFDHIHAVFYFWGKQGAYAHFCREWGDCIGNLRAWPFEENRSYQTDTAKEKLSGKPNEMKWSLIESEAELEAFSQRHDTRFKPADARALAEAIKTRFIRIYRDWYNSTGMSLILLRKPSLMSPGSTPQLEVTTDSSLLNNK